MRVLAIDLGTRRIGTAVCDELGITTRPLETVRRSSDGSDIARVKSLCEELSVEAVVVGMPIRMDGTPGDAARRTGEFVERLKEKIDLPVFTHDERLTSWEAEQIMAGGRMRRRERRSESDRIAAVIILRDFLSNQKIKS
jgi:putative Holliday junction resolvase